MTPSVLPVISTPMKRFFSHLPACVEASACGIWRASANISAMACSAVVIELPNGVFITMMPRAVAAGMSTLSTPMPARPITFRFLALLEDLRRDLGGGADGEAVVVADDLGELVLVLAEVGLEIDLDAAILEDLHGGGRQSVGDENVGHGVILSCIPCRASSRESRDPVICDGDRVLGWTPLRGSRLAAPRDDSAQAAFGSAALASAKAQSSQGVSASTSARLDRRAAPDAQARRRVAIGADVVGDAFLLQRRGDALGESRLRVGGERRAPPDRRPSGRPRCWSASPGRRPG